MLVDTDILKNHRQQRGWTQEHLATLCDLSVRTIQRCEKTGVASMETTQAVAAAFGVTHAAILADGGVKPAHTGVELKHLAVCASATFVAGILFGAMFF